MDRAGGDALRLTGDTTGTKRLGYHGSDERIGWRKRPGLISQIGKFDLSAATPFVFRTRNNKRAVVKQDFRCDVVLNQFANASKDEIDFALPQFPDLLRDYG